MISSVFLLSLLLCDSLAADEHGKDVPSLSEEGFIGDVGSKPHFIMFFAPWCGHCKSLAPTWNELSLELNTDEKSGVVIAKVDCTLETSLCSDQDVTGYPTLKFFKNGSASGVKYRGERDRQSLLKYISESLNASPEEEHLSLSQEPSLEKDIYILTKNSFGKHIEEGSHFVKFYAPWCGHCQKLSPVWEELASSFKDDSSVKISKIDCTEASDLCQTHNVKGYPTLSFFKNGVIVENYKGARNLKDLKDFLVSMTEGEEEEEKKKLKSEDVKNKEALDTDSSSESSLVIKLSSEDFEERIQSGFSFVKFYAPWCGHCKRLSPTWDQLSLLFKERKDISIAKVDCTFEDNKNKELCNAQGVNGFPTLNIYEDGNKITEYSGSRKLQDLEEFVKKHAGVDTRDEL